MNSSFSLDKGENSKIEIKIPKRFQPSKMVFNFSFITGDKKYGVKNRGFNQRVQKKFMDKLVFLSSIDFDVVLGLPKEEGLEAINAENVHFRVNSDFKLSGRHQDCLNDFWFFRLNQLGRVIGKIFDKTFYILCIDTTFDAYEHGS
ncbi:hypothetical protein WJM93_01865 [Lactiplantibacillus plantarum]|uniref:hypothetical protein n=1 Tax=Lactiplantibacillus plantarum TaxID=1590 RepID=UPI0030B2EFB7